MGGDLGGGIRAGVGVSAATCDGRVVDDGPAAHLLADWSGWGESRVTWAVDGRKCTGCLAGLRWYIPSQGGYQQKQSRSTMTSAAAGVNSSEKGSPSCLIGDGGGTTGGGGCCGGGGATTRTTVTAGEIVAGEIETTRMPSAALRASTDAVRFVAKVEIEASAATWFPSVACGMVSRTWAPMEPGCKRRRAPSASTTMVARHTGSWQASMPLSLFLSKACQVRQVNAK